MAYEDKTDEEQYQEGERLTYRRWNSSRQAFDVLTGDLVRVIPGGDTGGPLFILRDIDTGNEHTIGRCDFLGGQSCMSGHTWELVDKAGSVVYRGASDDGALWSLGQAGFVAKADMGHLGLHAQREGTARLDWLWRQVREGFGLTGAERDEMEGLERKLLAPGNQPWWA